MHQDSTKKFFVFIQSGGSAPKILLIWGICGILSLYVAEKQPILRIKGQRNYEKCNYDMASPDAFSSNRVQPI